MNVYKVYRAIEDGFHGNRAIRDRTGLSEAKVRSSLRHLKDTSRIVLSGLGPASKWHLVPGARRPTEGERAKKHEAKPVVYVDPPCELARVWHAQA